MNNIAPKLQKMLDTQNCLQSISKNAKKKTNFFYSQPSTLPKNATAKFYFSMTVGLSFMIGHAGPTRSSIFLRIFFNQNREP